MQDSSITEYPEIDLWRVDLNHLSHLEMTGFALLSDDESKRIDSIVVEKHRQRVIRSRVVLRLLLANYLSIFPNEVLLEYETLGKPYLHPDHQSDLQFNLSHSDDYWICAVTRRYEIGVDVQMRKSKVDFQGIADRYYSASEKTNLQELTVSQRVRCFFDVWARKEAFLKASGQGLSFGLDKIEVTVNAVEARILSINGDSEVTREWFLRDLELFEECSAAVVQHGPNARIRIKSADETEQICSTA
jgi:4'-phosphopantetheinyl transferase